MKHKYCYKCVKISQKKPIYQYKCNLNTEEYHIWNSSRKGKQLSSTPAKDGDLQNISKLTNEFSAKHSPYLAEEVHMIVCNKQII